VDVFGLVERGFVFAAGDEPANSGCKRREVREFRGCLRLKPFGQHADSFVAFFPGGLLLLAYPGGNWEYIFRIRARFGGRWR